MWHSFICRCYQFFGGTYCFHLQGSLIRLLTSNRESVCLKQWQLHVVTPIRLPSTWQGFEAGDHNALYGTVLEVPHRTPAVCGTLMFNMSLTIKTIYLAVSLHSISLPSCTKCPISVKRGCGSCIPSSTSSPSMNCTRWAGGVTGIFRLIVLTNVNHLFSEQTQNACTIRIINKALNRQRDNYETAWWQTSWFICVIYYTQSSIIQEVLIGWIHKMAEGTFYFR